MLLITAFLTGLLGSFHCIGMCGPIALALPNRGQSLLAKIIGRLLYNLGRILMYSALGVVLGIFGAGLKLAGLQQSISIAAGVMIIFMAVFTTNKIEQWLGNPFRLIRGGMVQRLFQSDSVSALFLIGLLNGLLPCGFVYVGLAGALATQDTMQGAVYMMCFGLGTTPMMFGVSMAGQFISLSMRSVIRRVIPYVAILIGVLFILRGLNLGISYISPKVSESGEQVKECCKPTQPGDHK